MGMIETVDLWKTYVMGTEEIHALRGVSVQIERGEYVAIMGPSGSGKSTLMNLIGCLDTPSKGSYLLNEKQVSQMNDNELARIRNEEIGFVWRAYGTKKSGLSFRPSTCCRARRHCTTSSCRSSTRECRQRIGSSARNRRSTKSSFRPA